MNKQQLRQLLAELEFRPGRRLGQNFLVDTNMCNYIVRTARELHADEKSDRTVLEIGPGFGVMTRKLLKSGYRVVAVEIDRRLCRYLRLNLRDEKFSLIEGDACRLDYRSIPELSQQFHCVANLPYSAASQLIIKMIEMPVPPKSMLLMLQKEMADRLCAGPETKNYGGLSVQVQSIYQATVKRIVAKQVFFPEPDVDSAIVAFSCREPLLSLEKRGLLRRLVKIAFGQRRKKMLTALSREFGRESCLSAFKQLKISEDIRAEQLSVNDFAKLADILDRKESL